MDNLTWLVLGVILMLIVYRLRSALRKAIVNDHKAEEIQQRLKELRKKRDEE